MTVKEVRQAVQAARPERPITLHLADGRSLQVPHVDYLFFPPVGHSIVLWTRQGNMRLIDAGLITELHLSPPSTRSRAGK
jgi:hypothetical protein